VNAEERGVAWLELILLVLLLVLLGIAAGRIVLALRKAGVGQGGRWAVTSIFAVAAGLTARRISIRWRGLRRGNGDGT
jgi:hypothetical protein